MTMFDPGHPSLFIKEELEATGATVAKAALAMKITRSQLHRIVKEQSAITIDFALKFEAIFGFKAELIWIHTWQTRRQAEIAIFEYINGFYNPRRRYSTLSWKSPLAFERMAA